MCLLMNGKSAKSPKLISYSSFRLIAMGNRQRYDLAGTSRRSGQRHAASRRVLNSIKSHIIGTVYQFNERTAFAYCNGIVVSWIWNGMVTLHRRQARSHPSSEILRHPKPHVSRHGTPAPAGLLVDATPIADSSMPAMGPSIDLPIDHRCPDE